ncbi:MAG: hypothetical protein AAGM22_31950 [Acidobacteriota bacterium]
MAGQTSDVTVYDLLQEMEATLEEKRRTGDPRLIKDHRLRRPSWLDDDDALSACFVREDQERLATSGVLVWAHIVQANTLLFKWGLGDHPANVVYSTAFDGDVARAAEVSQQLYSLKGGDEDYEDPQMTAIQDSLTTEHGREFNWLVPDEIALGQQILMTTIMIHRRLLPKRRLRGGFFPLLVLPEETVATVILSKRYWPKTLVNYWTS